MIEFSNGNTHKEFHVGHLRNICYGDAVAKILNFAGVKNIIFTDAKGIIYKTFIIGEGPGRYEEVKKVPFVGPSGRLLDKTLAIAGIDRAECFITNTTLCRPESDREADAAAMCCAPRLFREINQGRVSGNSSSSAASRGDRRRLPGSKAHSPRRIRVSSDANFQPPILCLGKPATRLVLGTSSILYARGFIWTAPAIDPAKVHAAWAKAGWEWRAAGSDDRKLVAK